MEVVMEQSANCQYLSFSLDGEKYAVSIEKIHEVLEYIHITPLPGMDAFMKGIVNIRGVGRRDDGFMIVPDIDRVLEAEEYRNSVEAGETTLSDGSAAEAFG
jgi:purine-binding chemotaxis protein CheW